MRSKRFVFWNLAQLKAFFVAIGMLFVSLSTAYSARMIGKVVVLGSDKALPAVSIMNVHAGKEVFSAQDGSFELEISKGQLVEFRAAGFDVAHIKVKSDNLAKYYLIKLRAKPSTIESQLMHDYFTGAKVDSIKRRELYQQALDHYKLTGLDIIQHPFDAMSKRNRMIWAFQNNYEIWERDKFVDYVFNDRLIVQLTGLSVDDIEQYKKQYRPNYELIRHMKEYQYYSYIKKSVAEFLYRKQRQLSPVDTTTEQYNYDR